MHGPLNPTNIAVDCTKLILWIQEVNNHTIGLIFQSLQLLFKQEHCKG